MFSGYAFSRTVNETKPFIILCVSRHCYERVCTSFAFVLWVLSLYFDFCVSVMGFEKLF